MPLGAEAIRAPAIPEGSTGIRLSSTSFEDRAQKNVHNEPTGGSTQVIWSPNYKEVSQVS